MAPPHHDDHVFQHSIARVSVIPKLDPLYFKTYCGVLDGALTGFPQLHDHLYFRLSRALLWRFLQVVQPDEEASESTAAHGRVSFKVPGMVAAGQHTFVAEWREHRAGLPQMQERSPAASVTVAPGQPADAQVLPPQLHVHS